MNPRWIRRLTQTGMLLLVVLAPMFGLWGVGATTRYAGEDMAYRYTEAGLRISQQMDGLLGDPTHAAASAVVGGPVSLRIFGVEFADPLMLPAMLVDGSLPTLPVALGIGGVLLLHLVLGRAFCGYLCPYGTLARLISRVRAPLKRAGLVVSWTVPRWLRWVLLGAVLLAPFFGMGLAPLVLPYVGVSRLAHAVLFGGVTGVLGSVLALLGSDLLLWDHGICRGVCPSGALQGALGKFRVVHLVARKGVGCQRSCHTCAEVCWLGLDPRTGDPGSDCDSCGRCIPDCPTSRLTVIVRPGLVKRPVKVAAMALLLPFLHSCTTGTAPEVLSANAPWASPFQPASEIERKRVRFVEHDLDGKVLGVGIAGTESGPQGLRLYLEEAPGEPWTGPLAMKMQNPAGEVDLVFEQANSPMGASTRTLYEAMVKAPVGTSLLMVDGPHAGALVPLPIAEYGRLSLGWLWAPAAVMLAWVMGLVLKRRKR